METTTKTVLVHFSVDVMNTIAQRNLRRKGCVWLVHPNPNQSLRKAEWELWQDLWEGT